MGWDRIEWDLVFGGGASINAVVPGVAIRNLKYMRQEALHCDYGGGSGLAAGWTEGGRGR